MYYALTIAGSDPSGGAGIQADLKTFAHFKVYGFSVITNITIQNTLGIINNYSLPAKTVAAQLEAILNDIEIDTAKIGMLGNNKITKAIIKILKRSPIKNLIIDPILFSKNQYPMIDKEAIKLLIDDLIPIAKLVTPNIYEASKLTNINIKNQDDMKDAAKKLTNMGTKAILLKGGHLKSNKIIDLFYDGKEFIPFKKIYNKNKNPHGTGCALSAAITANLAKKKSLLKSITIAENFITKAIALSFSIGKGYEQLNILCKN